MFKFKTKLANIKKIDQLKKFFRYYFEDNVE